MATVGTSAFTLADWAKQAVDGKIPVVVDLLSQTNKILDDILWVEGNQPTGHVSVIQTGYPTLAWRLLNYGVAQSKATTAKVTDTCGILEGYSEIDEDVAELNGAVGPTRLGQDRTFLAQMGQDMATTLFYGNTLVNPERFLGLSPRYSLTTAANGANIISGGSNDTDNTSVWLVCWDENYVHGIFPKGSNSMGIQHNDLGKETKTDAAGGLLRVYRSQFKWKAGLVVKDWRYVVRIANIEISDLLITAATGANLIDLMVQAIEMLPDDNVGRPIFYCNRTIRSWLRRQIANKANVNLTFDTAGGKRVLAFDEIPVHRCDALLNTESLVS